MNGKPGSTPSKQVNRSLWDRAFILIMALIVALPLTIFPASPGLADPTSAPGETAERVFGEGTSGHSQPEPDSKTGAMTYTYPFSLPAARGDLSPGLC